MRALGAILQHEMMGQTARFQRYCADMLYIIAAGKRIDDTQTPRFGEICDRIYKNPYQRKGQSAEEIKQHILKRLEE